MEAQEVAIHRLAADGFILVVLIICYLFLQGRLSIDRSIHPFTIYLTYLFTLIFYLQTKDYSWGVLGQFRNAYTGSVCLLFRRHMPRMVA